MRTLLMTAWQAAAMFRFAKHVNALQARYCQTHPEQPPMKDPFAMTLPELVERWDILTKDQPYMT